MEVSVDSLMQLVNEAISLALDCYAEGDDAPFVLAHDDQGGQHLFDLRDCGQAEVQSLVELGRDLLVDQSQAILVYAGFVTSDRERHPAVIAEPAARNSRLAMRIVQPYEYDPETQKCLAAGEPIILGLADESGMDGSGRGSSS